MAKLRWPLTITLTSRRRHASSAGLSLSLSLPLRRSRHYGAAVTPASLATTTTIVPSSPKGHPLSSPFADSGQPCGLPPIRRAPRFISFPDSFHSFPCGGTYSIALRRDSEAFPCGGAQKHLRATRTTSPKAAHSAQPSLGAAVLTTTRRSRSHYHSAVG